MSGPHQAPISPELLGRERCAEIRAGWGRLVVWLTSHSVGGLSRNDFIMAARIDRLAGA